jgi:hypothetical protein
MAKDASIAAPPAPLDPHADERPALDEADHLAAAVLRAELRLRKLQTLSEIGLELTLDLQERVRAGKAEAPATKAGAAEVTPPDYAAAFAKLSRSVRLTLELEARADEALRALRAGETTARETRRQAYEGRAEEAADEQREAARDRIHTQVWRAITTEAETEEEYNERLAALRERMEFDPAYDEAEERPFREVVEQLCGDLGLSPDWSAWTEEEGWPEPVDHPPYRRRSSSFNRVSPKPILKANQNWSRDLASKLFELADNSS